MPASTVVVDASCTARGDCSAQLQAALSSCRAGCVVQLAPAGGTFMLEQTTPLNAVGAVGLRFEGAGARLVLGDGTAQLLRVANSSSVSLSNFSVHTTRTPFTFGVVVTAEHLATDAVGTAGAVGATGAAEDVVLLRVDAARYPMDNALRARLPWLERVAALHEVEDEAQQFRPTAGGLDWIARAGEPAALLNLTVLPSAPSPNEGGLHTALLARPRGWRRRGGLRAAAGRWRGAAPHGGVHAAAAGLRGAAQCQQRACY